MPIARFLSNLLDFLGRHATWVLFLGVFLGLAVPPLATLARPLLLPAVVLLLTAMLLRIDWQRMGAYARRPGLASVLVIWILGGAPILAWLLLQPLPLPESLEIALVLMAAGPPILSSAAIALLLGLDGALAIVVGLTATLLTPLTVPPLALALLGLDLDISLAVFMGRLAAIVATAFLLALAVRRAAPSGWLVRNQGQIDGFVVCIMLLFGVAIMDGVTARLITDPGQVILWTAVAFVANPALQALGILAFAWLGRRRALTVGLITGNCNMGLMLAALPPQSDFGVLLYFAVAQLPIFMLPALLLPVYRRLLPNARGVTD